MSSLIALISWGLRGVFSKLASRYLDVYQIYVTSGLVTLIALTTVFFLLRSQIDVESPGFSFSILPGVVGTLALIAFYSAISAGKASIVVPLTALLCGDCNVVIPDSERKNKSVKRCRNNLSTSCHYVHVNRLGLHSLSLIKSRKWKSLLKIMTILKLSQSSKGAPKTFIVIAHAKDDLLMYLTHGIEKG